MFPTLYSPPVYRIPPSSLANSSVQQVASSRITDLFQSSNSGNGVRTILSTSPLVSTLPGVTTHPEALDLPQWQTFPSGTNNAITDVPGVKVGHMTFLRDYPSKIRTGVTAIVPDAAALTHGQGNLATTGFRASSVCLNGNGELTGTSFINEFGVLNGPVLFTNTRAVGTVYDGVDAYFDKYYPGQWSAQLPVVGECYDGVFNNVEENVIPASSVESVINHAQSGPVFQGRIGAGTGMRCFELHGGIGSASRKITLGDKQYTIGILVNTNHSHLDNLNPVIRQQLESRLGPLDRLKVKDNQDYAPRPPVNSPRQGSIQVVIATDLPLSNKQLEEMGKRAALGIGNTGSDMATTSGDFATVFTTANPVPMGKEAPTLLTESEIHPDDMNPVFRATVEAVTEAQINALVASHAQ